MNVDSATCSVLETVAAVADGEEVGTGLRTQEGRVTGY